MQLKSKKFDSASKIFVHFCDGKLFFTQGYTNCFIKITTWTYGIMKSLWIYWGKTKETEETSIMIILRKNRVALDFEDQTILKLTDFIKLEGAQLPCATPDLHLSHITC